MSVKQKILFGFLFLVALFSSQNLAAIATNPELKGFPDSFHLAVLSTFISEQNVTGDQEIKDRTINFQVNSEISYNSISQFVKPEAKQFFVDALSKENILKKLIVQTDSLRKTYAVSNDQEKEKTATLILDAEKKVNSLSEEIPFLYEKARITENQYWQTASSEDKAKFQKQMQASLDSIQQLNNALARQKQSTSVPDTITFYRAGKAKEAVVEPVSAVVYKIQVGSFKTKLPETAAKAIKKLEILRKVENYKDEKGVTILTTGNLKSYQEALTLLNQVKLEGIKNATITAFNNGKKITNEEAKKLTNESSIKP
jgi:hypothetical protein